MLPASLAVQGSSIRTASASPAIFGQCAIWLIPMASPVPRDRVELSAARVRGSAATGRRRAGGGARRTGSRSYVAVAG